MKKRMIAVLFVMVCGLVFANGLSENPAETLIPDDAQLTFMPNAWAKTSYNRALFNLELDQSEFNFGFGVKFGVFKLGLKLKSDYNFIFPHKSYSESVTETMENGESKDSTTVITSHGSEFGEDSLIIDGVLNLGIGNHFGIFLNVDGYRQTTYLTPYTETVTKGKYGLISGSSSVNSTGISTGCNGDFFGINFNFNKNDFFLKAIGGFYSESPGYVRVWDAENDTTTREVETFGPRFDLGFEISKENTNHEVDLSFYTGKMDMGSYEQSFSKIWLKGDYIYSHIFENSSIFSIYGGLDFTSAEHSMFSGDNSIKTIALIPSVKLALKYPVVQDKLFLSLGASGNISGFTRSVQNVLSKTNNADDSLSITATRSVIMDRVPVQTTFYGGLIFDITDSFTVKTSIDLGAKDVTSGVLDYSFAVQGTYKF